MAAVTWETTCIENSSIHSLLIDHFDFWPYNIVCLCSSFVGILGAVYQLLPCSESNDYPQNAFLGERHRIIKYLATADLLACFGLFVRAIIWFHKDYTESLKQEFPDREVYYIFCLTSENFIHSFFISTYMWVLCYAIEVYNICAEKHWRSMKYYHLVSWGVPILFTTCNVLLLIRNICFTGTCRFFRVLLYFTTTCVPIFLVMIIIPFLYYYSSKHIKTFLISRQGQFECLQREELSALKEQFFLIVLVFYVCWSPNLLHSIYLWSSKENTLVEFVHGLWYYLALMNPMQSVMNSLVYRRLAGCSTVFYGIFCCLRRHRNDDGVDRESSSSSEESPFSNTFSDDDEQRI